MKTSDSNKKRTDAKDTVRGLARRDARRYSRQGGALVTVLVIAASVTLVLGGLSASSYQRMRIMRDESSRMKALAIAEAGVSTTFGLLDADTTLTETTSDFAGGSYAVTITAPAPNMRLITARGTYGEQTATAAATVAVAVAPSGGEEVPSTLHGPFGDVMLAAGGDLIISGGINVDLGAFGAHCNGNLLFSGGPHLSAKNVSAVGTLTFSGNPQLHLDGGAGRAHGNGLTTLYGMINAACITSSTQIKGNWGTTTAAINMAPLVTWPNYFSPVPSIEIQDIPMVQPLPLPEIDAEAFRTFAIANDYYYVKKNLTIDRTWLTADILRRTGVNVNNNATVVAPQGGVLYIDGNVSIASDMRIEGMVAATGNITIGGAATLNNTTPYPGLLSVNGNIILGGGANGPTLNGWIYALNGSVSAGGGATGCGIVAKQNITVTAGYAIGSFTGSPFMWPGKPTGGENGGGQGGGNVSLIAWTR